MESAELIALLQQAREQVRARNPQTSAPGNVPLPDLMPLVHARDAALGKAAAIGTVNPRRGGPLNALVQGWKRLLARVLDWHVREQVIFNRKTVECIDAALDALNQSNRALAELAGRIEAHQQGWEELQDIRRHWAEWRGGWETKLRDNEVHYLRNVGELHAAFQHRVTLLEATFREAVRAQHADFTAALREGMEQTRREFERVIHAELKLIRQRAGLGGAERGLGTEGPALPPAPVFDYGAFAERFRGSEDRVKAGQQVYVPYFTGRRRVLDIGCGRGEFLELMRAAGVEARGIDRSAESVALCRGKGLEAEQADLFLYLAGRPEAGLDGIFCAQVVEHLPPERLPEFLKLAARCLEPGGVIAIETPNPECLAIFATYFYLDPTHTRPVPHPLLVFYLEEFGIGAIEVKKLSPALDSMPALATLPPEFREGFFGGLDYCVIGRKLPGP
ncbi:MAG TPA: class I SAM-dependent methyltransferase [Bryobacteraceae bacterium]|nr:class I SAM-dependent methyltransferase [Bryobacteraceae bacterium]